MYVLVHLIGMAIFFLLALHRLQAVAPGVPGWWQEAYLRELAEEERKLQADSMTTNEVNC